MAFGPFVDLRKLPNPIKKNTAFVYVLIKDYLV